MKCMTIEELTLDLEKIDPSMLTTDHPSNRSDEIRNTQLK